MLACWFWSFCLVKWWKEVFEGSLLHLLISTVQLWSCVASFCWATLQHFITMLKGHPNVKLNTHAQILFQVDIEQSDKTHRLLGPGYSYAAGCDVLPGKPHSPIPCGDPCETFTHIRTIAPRSPTPAQWEQRTRSFTSKWEPRENISMNSNSVT